MKRNLPTILNTAAGLIGLIAAVLWIVTTLRKN